MAKTCPVCGRVLDSNDSCSFCGYKEYKEKLREEARNDVLYDSTKPEFRGSKYEKEFEDSKDTVSSYSYGESTGKSDFFEKTEKKAMKRGVAGIAIGIVALALIIVAVVAVSGFSGSKDMQKQFDNFADITIDNLINLEDMANMIVAVGYDCIDKEKNDDTKAYTMNSGGMFYDDYFDAIDAYFASDEYYRLEKKTLELDEDIYDLYYKIVDDMYDYDTGMYNALCMLMDYYDEFADFALGPIEDIDDFYDTFCDLEDDFAQVADAVVRYISE